jgi:hypothetical protein
MPTVEEELAAAIAKLTDRELRLIAHVGASVYTEQVRFFSPSEGEKVEQALAAAAKASTDLSPEMNLKIAAAAKARTAMTFR